MPTASWEYETETVHGTVQTWQGEVDYDPRDWELYDVRLYLGEYETREADWGPREWVRILDQAKEAAGGHWTSLGLVGQRDYYTEEAP